MAGGGGRGGGGGHAHPAGGRRSGFSPLARETMNTNMNAGGQGVSSYMAQMGGGGGSWTANPPTAPAAMRSGSSDSSAQRRSGVRGLKTATYGLGDGWIRR